MSDAFSRSDVRLANWRTHPFNRWTFQNVREIVPTVEIAAARGETEASPGAGPLPGLDLSLPDGSRIAALDHLAQSHGDAFVAMKDGRLVAEWHAPHADPDAPHLIFSVSKSVTGLLAGIAAADGALDPDAPITTYLDVPPGGAYHDATVRHLLDMTVSLSFEENYLDRQSDFDRYRRAMLWNPEHEAGQDETLEEVLVSLPRAAHPHGTRFHYASPNTDLLGLVIERATGTRFHAYLRDRLWRHLGGRGAANVTVDRAGTARAAGGISVTARDLARLGQMMLDGGAAGGRQVVPADWVEDIRTKGDRQAWVAGDFAGLFGKGRYRSCWYDTGDDHGSLAAIGIHEQWIWIDPTRRVVLVKLSSRPEPSHEPSTLREKSVLRQIARLI
ncbi:class C beta-lactamase-related serine hydrolase [Aquibium carbonis]|uniref:Class C beta-lactamase-related serine hydrolase n=1 Tax=Aquibium carbonis TaxID=2495581 RepID=A0A3S0A3B9_9HYPH|nr:serine hydrolase [Aquibium carbonis]RST87925.1 class C beta-lactamase-related serine hydrolase [Aquibium carbonis]